jgi:L-amino acid N-acyltransferase YncA
VSSPVAIRPAASSDAGAIAGIYDEGIAGGIATFATGPHSAEERRQWLANRDPRAPVVVASVDDNVVGWGALAPFSHRPWFSGVAEYTAYVSERARGAGVGRVLLDHLISIAPGLDYWKLVGVIFPENAAGLALARGAGFEVVGTHRAHGQSGGVWRDVTLVELHLAQP